MNPDNFQVRVAGNKSLSEWLQRAAFKAGYLWAGHAAEVIREAFWWMIFEPDKKIYYSHQTGHQPRYGVEVSAKEALRIFNAVSFHGIDCTIPEGD